jgi:subtilisin family serine protease
MNRAIRVWVLMGAILPAAMPDSAAAAYGGDEEKYVTVFAKKAERLSRELNALVTAGGELVGHAEGGGGVLRLGAAGIKKLSGSPVIDKVVVGKPEKLRPVERLTVMYEPENPVTAEQLADKGFKVLGHNKEGSFFVVMPKNKNGIQAAAVTGLIADKKVKYVEPVYRYSRPPVPAKEIKKEAEAKKEGGNGQIAPAKVKAFPNDEHFAQLWGMTTINAPLAWKKINASPSVVVAVIDTGVDYNHFDLKDNMWVNPKEKKDNKDDDGNEIADDIHGANFFGSSGMASLASGDPMDIDAHGTHCAGTIGAVGNTNGKGVAGVTWNVKIMALRFMGPDANGDITGDSTDAAACIDYARLNGANILSNSWGGGGESQVLKDAIGRAEKAGILFIAAAGNGDFANISLDNDLVPHFPSSYPHKNIIAVLAVNSDDTLGAFLNFATTFSNFGKTSVHIGAPGGRNKALNTYILSTTPKGKFEAWPGTSMATPHVAGAAALVWARQEAAGAGDPKTRWSEVRDLLITNARQISHLKDKCTTGGILNIEFLSKGP